MRLVLRSLVWLVLTTAAAGAAETPKPALPPGWLPVARLDAKANWTDFRKIDDRVHLYLPSDDRPVRGIFVCYVFHSADPRELADAWNFALVAIPTPFEYDLGFHDRRNPEPNSATRSGTRACCSPTWPRRPRRPTMPN